MPNKCVAPAGFSADGFLDFILQERAQCTQGSQVLVGLIGWRHDSAQSGGGSMGFRFELTSTTPRTREVKPRRTRLRVVAGWLALVFIATLPAFGVEPYSVEPVQLNSKDVLSPVPAGKVPANKGLLDKVLADQLDPQGWRLFTYGNGLKITICEIFLVKAASVQDRQAGARPHYSDLEPGSLVGVIHFLPETDGDYREDFHDQKLEPGYYSMRYAPRPKGDPSEVLLLSPARADREAERVLSPDELDRRSRLASGTSDPAVLSLVPPELTKEDAPIVRMDDQGTCILQVKLTAKSSGGSPREATLAVILVTPRKGEGDAS